MFGKHSCGDCKLACVECSAQICPKCMVQCPVGNRCRPCADKTSSHAVKLTPGALLKAGGGALVVGAAYGFLGGSVPMFGFYSWIAVYVIGCLVGNGLHRLSGFKLGPKISGVVVGCLIAGALVPMFLIDKTGDMMADAAAQIELQRAMQNAQRHKKAVTVASATTKPGEELADAKDKPAANSEAGDKEALSKAAAAPADDDDVADPAATAAALAKARAAQRQAMLIPSLISLCLFCVGAVTPFAGWMPMFFDRFRR